MACGICASKCRTGNSPTRPSLWTGIGRARRSTIVPVVVSGMRIPCSTLSLVTLSAFAQTWTQLPDFPGTARDDAASFSIGGKVYVGTGMDVGFSLTNDWYAFDTWTETWDVTSPLPGTSRQYCSGFSINDFGYLF